MSSAPAETIVINGFKVPKDATRIQVADPSGKVFYIKVDQVLPEHRIQTTPAGDPIVQTQDPGTTPKALKAAVRRDPSLDASMKLTVWDPAVDEPTFRALVMEGDPITKAIDSSPDSPDVLTFAIRALAEEQAHLRFSRFKAEKAGQETSLISTRRISALTNLAAVWIRRREQLATKVIDLESVAFEIVFAQIIKTFVACLEDAGETEMMIQKIMNIASKRFNDPEWRKETIAKMKV